MSGMRWHRILNRPLCFFRRCPLWSALRTQVRYRAESEKCQEATFLDYDTAVIANRATTNAGGMTIIPSFRNCHTVTASPSRLKAISHRIVASEPVTERLGPRSTPINVALVTCRGTSALWLTVAATKPVGRLFI